MQKLPMSHITSDVRNCGHMLQASKLNERGQTRNHQDTVPPQHGTQQPEGFPFEINLLGARGT